MKRLCLITLLLLLVTALVLGGGCKASAPGRTEIVVGVNTPLTGTFAAYGQACVFALKVAIDQINQQGGVYVADLGKKLPIRAIHVDDQSDGIKAATLTTDLILRDKVDFLIAGSDEPSAVFAIANAAEKYQTLNVCYGGPFEPFVAARNAAGGWKYTWALGFSIATSPQDFRNSPGYTVAGNWMTVLKMFADQTNKRVALFAADEPDARGWYTGFGPVLKQAGFDVVGMDRELGIAPLNTTDFSSVISEWKRNDCQIMWANGPGPFFGTMLRQANAMGFKPKLISVGKAANLYSEVNAWGGDLPWGVSCDQLWHPSLKEYKGVGGETPVTLNDKWMKATGEPINAQLGNGYAIPQVLVDAIERAGSLDKVKVAEALGKTDLMTMVHRVSFDKENQFSVGPDFFGQWFKVNTPHKWELRIVYSEHDFYPVTDKPIFPIP